MSEKYVDVLDVLRVARIGCKLNAGNGDAPILKRIDDARAAVAELIEATSVLCDDLERYDEEGLIGHSPTMRLARAALSAVRPSQGDGGGKGEGEKVG